MKNYIKKKPYSLSLSITDGCNSRCVYCNFWKTKKPVYIEPRELEIMFKKSKILRGVKQFSITGGEPTLHPKFEELFDVIFKYAKPIKVSMVSNGLNVNVSEKIKKVVQKHGRKKFRMKFSLDGTREYYKKTRGVDGFQMVVKNIKEMSKIIDVSIGFTITDENHEQLKIIEGMFPGKVIAHPVEEIQYYGSTSKTTKGLPKDLTHKHPVFKLYYAYLRRAIKTPKRIHKCMAGTVSININQKLDVFSCIKVPVPFANLRDYDLNFDKLYEENIERVRKTVDTQGCSCFCTGDIIPSILRDFRWLRAKK
ncbi:MAG: radical SAM protein [Nanoarchaeota archaeon]|nr:radical SAM protein [Nanoarchaeota archaeon]